jgi:alpha-galactosidase
MHEVGNPGITPGEQRAHFFAWVAIKAPLILGNDVRNMNDATSKLLSNPEHIAVNQDQLGQSARLVRRVRSATGNLDTWVSLLAEGGYVAVLINRGVTAEKFGLPKSLFGMTAAAMSMNVRDLFARSNLGVYSDTIEVVVEPHDARILKVNAFSGIAVQN